MDKEVKIESRTMTDESDRLWELEYCVRKFDIRTGNVFYGIKIEQRPVNNSLTDEVVSEESGGLTYSYEEAEKWVKQLAAGGVMPSTFHDHVDDFVGG